MGLFTPLGIRPSLDPFGDSPPVLGSFGNAIAESVRWQFPAELDDAREPGLHLAYWHFRLLAQLFSPCWSPGLSLQCCRNLVRLLMGNALMINPLTHHFVSLCSLVLMELSKVENVTVREEATKLAKDLIDYDIAPSPWNVVVRAMLGEKTPSPSLTSSETSQTLQTLAELAASVEGTAPLSSEAPTTGQNEVPTQVQEQNPAPAADTAAETLKEELLDSIKGLGDEPQPAPPAPAAPSAEGPPTHNGNHNTTSLPELQPQEQKPLDPQAILRSGYLTLFDAITEQPQEQPSSAIPS